MKRSLKQGPDGRFLPVARGPDGEREAVEARARELCRGFFDAFTPARRARVMALAANERLLAMLEREAYRSRRKILDSRSGRIKGLFDRMIELRASLAKELEWLDAALDAMEPETAKTTKAEERTPFAEYLARREAVKVASLQESQNRPVERFLAPEGVGVPEEKGDALSDAFPMPLDAFRCECGKEIPPRARGGSDRRFCSPQCQKKAWERKRKQHQGAEAS